VHDPKAFLSAIRAVSAPNASIIISCPNDNWYYPDDKTSNPFHVRKYSFQDFKTLSEDVLGKATSWRLGSLTAGFASVGLDQNLIVPDGADQTAMLRIRDIESAMIVPGEAVSSPTIENCSFFVGIWGPDAGDISSVTFPLSMDFSDRSLFGGVRLSEMNSYIQSLEEHQDKLKKRISDLDGYVDQLNAHVAELGKSLRSANLRLRATSAENEALRDRAREARQQLAASQTALEDKSIALDLSENRARELQEQLTTIPWRVVSIYWRLRRFIPRPVLSFGASLLRFGARMARRIR
jgi:hypothetical protein